MDTRKWIILMAAVLFLGVSSPVEACRCIRNHLQQSYCAADMAVLKMKFDGATERPVPNSQDKEKGYKVIVEKVMRGNEKWKSWTFISTMAGTSCEYNPTELNKDYLVIASTSNDKLSVNLCSNIEAWSKMTHMQKKGVEGAYKKGCSCNIVFCSTPPCPNPEKTCTVEDYTGGNGAKQLKDEMCVPRTGTTCKWTKRD